MNDPARYDVLISGGGMVGMTLALALGKAGLGVAVADAHTPSDVVEPEFDGRASAIAYAGVQLLRAIGVWPHLAPDAQPIDEIRVSDGNSPLYLHFDHRDLGDAPLGMMVENRHLRAALYQSMAETPEITLHAPGSFTTVKRGPGRVDAELAGGGILTAPLIIAAEGRTSRLRDEAGIRVYDWRYGQTAIVTTVAHREPHNGIAHERFLPGGPFAILPLTGNRSSIVWTEQTKTAATLLGLGERGFNAELGKRFGDFLGPVSAQGPRWSYPLSLHLVDRVTDRRLALVGDSAHGIHPIAGQGLNLGLKDVAALAEVVVDAKRLGEDIGSELVLDRYARWRNADTILLSAATDGLNRLFSNDITPLRMARDLGLGLVHRIPALKRLFMAHARGSMGDLPRLLTGRAL